MEAGCVMSSMIRVKTKPRIQVDFQEMGMGAQCGGCSWAGTDTLEPMKRMSAVFLM